MQQLIKGLPDILKYGVTGLSAVVAILSFWLLSAEQKKPNPRPGMLQTIGTFMGVSIVLCIVSGIFWLLSNGVHAGNDLPGQAGDLHTPPVSSTAGVGVKLFVENVRTTSGGTAIRFSIQNSSEQSATLNSVYIISNDGRQIDDPDQFRFNQLDVNGGLKPHARQEYTITFPYRPSRGTDGAIGQLGLNFFSMNSGSKDVRVPISNQ